jgi:hydroxyacylglutathione hydrolase
LGKLELFEQLGGSIFIVPGKNGGRFPYSNSILIAEDNNKSILVDTGCGLEKLSQIKKSANVVKIINSHTHPDHSAGNWVFRESAVPLHVPAEGFGSSWRF